ncbi:MAG: hypothetical protein HPY66_0054 [Firmicutes bacterium]|nr:hypothetical protein [Bacillota bacterium]MDI6706873.1 hypothetical protein [Bacillota bacterium]
MERSIDKYIAVDSRGNIWIFSINTAGYLNYMVKRGKDEAIGNTLDLGKRVKEFSMDMDSRDNINLIALTYDNEVVYMRYNLVEWNKQILYKFSGTSNIISSPYLVSGDETIHLLYSLSDSNGNSALFHHRWDGKRWTGFKVNTFAKGANLLCVDMYLGAGGAVHLAYSDGDSVELWRFDNDNWVKMAVGKGDGYTKVTDMVLQENYMMVMNGSSAYFVKDVERLNDNGAVEIVTGMGFKKGPIIVNRKKTLHVAWADDGKVKYCSSYDGGSSWSRGKLYNNMQESDFEVYGFINKYTPLVKAKRVVATNPAELHIPFLHRPMERVRFSREIMQNSPPPVNSEMPDPVQARSPYETDRVTQAAVNEDAVNMLREAILEEIRNTKSDLEQYSRQLNKGLEERVKRLEEEIENVKSKLQGMKPGSRVLVKPAGNVITQEMINECLKRSKE